MIFWLKCLTNKGFYAKIYYCVEPHSTTARKRFKRKYLTWRVLDYKGGIKMKAVIETGGKQYYVTEGSIIYIEKIDEEKNKTVKFDKVLMIDSKVGQPYVDGAEVSGEVLKHGKNKKIIVYKYNQKKNYHKKQGHRQPYTKIEIKSIKVK